MKFEDNLNKLEGLVAKMESGDMKLDQMIVAFEEGRKLVETCQKDLESIRQRIDKLTKDGVKVMNDEL
jgi:exodeoxyribonuclease VII small subunit